MWSVPRAASEASACALTVSARRLPEPSFMPILVATTMSSRLPRSAIQAPTIFSDSPPAYRSAVSMKLPPAAA